MKINRVTWTTFLLLSTLSLSLWYKFSYPQLAFVNFTINKYQALSIAKDYLKKRDAAISEYRTAIVYSLDRGANRYLQKTLGFQKLKQFIQEHDLDMFLWIVRFFKEHEKEEYRLSISTATGEITGIIHTVDDSAAREAMDRETAKDKVSQFLTDNFDFNPDEYTLHGDLQNSFDNRVDFSFSWQKKNVSIPWSEDKNSGTGKLLIGAKISGNEILSFSKNTFSVPDQFNRFLDRQNNIGRNLTAFIRLFYIGLFTAAIFYLIIRRNHLAMHTTKKFYISIMLIFFVLSLLSSLNQFQQVLFDYRTTSSFESYLWRVGINTLLNILFFSFAILMPSLSGELLHYEVLKDKKEGSFLYYIHSTFSSRSVAQAICLGYCVWFIMLGIQSLMIQLGQQYLGVWVEHSWMDNLSTAYLPFLAALTVGFTASFSEEIMYRLFAISFGKKLFKNTLIAVVLTSLIWGFAHSNYPVYPMWFRGIEVTFLGLFLSLIYLRYGIIPVLVGHYLFDVFWHSSGYLLGHAQPFYFYSALLVLLIPLMLSIIAFVNNKQEIVKPLRWQLNRHQIYNLEILKAYLNAHRGTFNNKTKEEIKREVSSHGWDLAVVEMALENFEDA